MDNIYQRATQATQWLKNNIETIPDTALVLGSGLGSWLMSEKISQRIAYAQIPHFPVSTVQGHAGALLVAQIGDTPVLILSGRFHLYEGYSAAEVTLPIRCLGLLDIKHLILTNAAGALDPLFQTGGLMLITDHINMTGHNPLTGRNVDEWGPRFPDMSQVYCPHLRSLALRSAMSLGLRLEQGVYVAVAGPSLETPAETRMYRTLGAHAIGMSTVPEAIIAHHMGIKTLGLSCLTNKNLPDCMAPTSHEAILDQAQQSASMLENLLTVLVPALENKQDQKT
ncbi:MAG: purine-nucleoside phosphorylase [Desulfomicrobium sp.]|nr:purine-nucleoside phosphorylase [Desulfomicrobium sp.]NLV96179.1 purine-nucleoside phosphorylase [Desulfovibrionales bacterium]